MPGTTETLLEDYHRIASNVRRLMARDGLTFEDLVTATGLDERTIRGLLHTRSKPHARTIHRLAEGLGVSVDELFREPVGAMERSFDRATNPLIEQVVAEHPHTFTGWSAADFDELHSRFGAGGQLTDQGALAAAQAMNDKREVLNQVRVILESSESDVLAGIVKLLYRRVSYDENA